MASSVPQKKAVAYCRVSSLRQVKEGHGLSSQETRCREYAKHKNYEIVETFHDEGISGSLTDRPSMRSMLEFLNEQKDPCVVLIDDISRLARGLEAHIELRTTISAAGGILESPSIEFGDDSDSRLVENLLASVSQHARQKNTEQVVNRMRARAMGGYWVANPTVGYKYDIVEGHGKLLVRDEPIASIVQEALEGFASGRLETQAEVKRFLEGYEAYPKGKDGKVHYQRVASLLSRELYAGYITLPKWGIHLQPAKHEPIITFETFQRNQKRLNGQAKAPARKDSNQDFPLRGFVRCSCCEEVLTGGFSKGRNKLYAYYWCYQKSCEKYGKSIKRDQLEDDFEQMLIDLRPTQNLFYLAHDMFNDLWEKHRRHHNLNASSIADEKRVVEGKIQKLIGRIVESDSPTLISAYEGGVKELEGKKVDLSEKLKNCGRELSPLDDTFRTAFEFLADPHKLWASGRLAEQRTTMKLVFTALHH